jgi:hypothetical protein
VTRRKSSKRKRKPDPASLLSSLAASLNACDRAGLRVKLRHGIVFTDAGFVLVIKDKWAVRLLKKLR